MAAQSKFLSAAIVAIAASSLVGFSGKKSSESTEAASSGGEVKCWGAHSCKGEQGCGVSKKDIAAVQAKFGKEKFKHAFVHECGGDAKCAAKNGNLGWEKVSSKKACFDKGGFLIEKDADGNKKVITG